MNLNPPRIAVVGGDLSTDAAAIQSTLLDRFQDKLIDTVIVSADDLSDPDIVNSDDLDLLIWVGAERYPADAVETVTAFLQDGGDLVAIGAPPFSIPMWKHEGDWLSLEDVKEALKLEPPAQMLFDFESPADRTGWTREYHSNSDSTLSFETAGSNTYLHSDAEHFDMWDLWKHDVTVTGTDDAMLIFKAKGDSETDHVFVEITEADGSRWTAVPKIGTDWDTVALWPGDFTYWPSNPSRGGPGDRVSFTNAEQLVFGLAMSHSSVTAGEHSFSIDDIGISPAPLYVPDAFPAMDGLTPAYKFFPVGDSSYIHADPAQTFVSEPTELEVDNIASVHPRPQGTGYNNARDARFIPLLSSYNANHDRSGYLAWMTVNGSPDATSDYAGGVWSVFSTSDPAAYLQEELVEAVADAVLAMQRSLFLIEGGSEHYAYIDSPEEIALGATVGKMNTGAALEDLSVRWTVKNGSNTTIYTKTEDVVPATPSADYAKVTDSWEPVLLTPGTYTVTTELLEGNILLDRARHELHIWQPKPLLDRAYVTGEDGHFQLDGERWFAYGINYFPSSAMAREDGTKFINYLSRNAYDPVAVDEDLRRLQDIGFNMISAAASDADFNLGSWNIIDFLIRAEKYGLKVNLNIYNADPFSNFSPQYVGNLIEKFQLADNDTLMAYDIAWEREWGKYEPWYFNHLGRKGHDDEWEKWVVSQYGSIANAETIWGQSIPRTTGGAVTGPSDTQIDVDGSHRKMVAAYRRFVDDFAGRVYLETSQYIKSLDPHHMVSFRMNHSGDPTTDPSLFPYDFQTTAPSLDIMEPEGYGRHGDWEVVKPGMFTAAYSRYAAPTRPLLWSEAGMHIWSGDNFAPDAVKLAKQAQHYEDFLEMIKQSDADGIAFWWSPGGFRFDEKSDYGVTNPDGSDRPVTEVLRDYAPILKDPGPSPTPDYIIEVDRDANTRGVAGMYDEYGTEYWTARSNGKFPALTDAGRSTTSANTPLLSIGDTTYNANNPPKYLNALFEKIEISLGDNNWVELKNGTTYLIPQESAVYLRSNVINTHSASWIAPTTTNETGAVYLTSAAGSDLAIQMPIEEDADYLARTAVESAIIAPEIDSEAQVTLHMTALNRMHFGEKLSFTLKPDESGVLTAIKKEQLLNISDSVSGWSPVGPHTIEFDTVDKKEGEGALRFEEDELLGISRTFSLDLSGMTLEQGRIGLWLYISDTDNMLPDGRIELGSAGVGDTNSFNWNLGSLSLSDGWNYLQLRLKDATTAGTPDPEGLNFIRIYQWVDDTTTMKVDQIGLDMVPQPYQTVVIDNMDSWSAVGPHGIAVDTLTKQEGTGSLSVEDDVLAGISRTFAANLTGMTVGSGQLELWLYISDTDLMDTEGRVELGSAWVGDDDSYSWNLASLSLQDGWNRLILPLDEATATAGTPEPDKLNYIRIYQWVTGTATLKVDDISLKIVDTETSVIGIDNADGWFPVGSHSLNIDTVNKKEGVGAVSLEDDELLGLSRTFSAAFPEMTTDGELSLWLYISDTDLMDTEGRIELGSDGAGDSDSYSWYLPNLSLRDGWNLLNLTLDEAVAVGTPDPQELNYIRIYQFVTDPTVMKVDQISLRMKIED